MRDPLTDLVRRTRRPESTVQPRLPSAYEASPQAMHELVVEQDAVARASVEPRPPVSTREHTPPPPMQIPRDGHPSAAVVTTGIRSTPAVPVDTVDHERRHARAAASPSPDVAPRSAAHVTPVMSPGRVPAPVDAVAPATPPRVPSADVASREARIHTPVPIQPATRSELPPTRGVRAESLGEDRADGREQAAPEIRISIGRIEVRATAAERPPARRQASSGPPPLTLDDYLAARARRGTR